ncbi:MAG: dephospho-CoA kinase [Bacteroidetes bacterium SB0662_bin_6]|nr:dephospho-CoA kinase [Bacteroidetes bacterium SB0668_bin_1]MYE04617.1 dephospho-CoA kinase [Bacteroidetes bacterium SB0662_bin_6]
MKRLGVTGGIGSGKTTVCRMLEELGAQVFYADDEAKRLLASDASIRRNVIDLFGPESYLPDGSPNRRFIARMAFADKTLLDRLNAAVHPPVLRRFEEAAQQAQREGAPLMVKEAALIFEAGADRQLDIVAVVEAPLQVRIERVCARDGVSQEEVAARMTHQADPSVLRERADIVLANDGDPEQLRRKVERLYRDMTSR